MQTLIVSLAALMASALTLFSGFGLGTLLMPIVAVFVPIDVAIAVTALVHLANNLFKLLLLGRHASRPIVISFGIPAVVSAFAGALVLGWLSDLPPILEYIAIGKQFEVSPIKLTVGVLILCFVVLELSPRFATLALDKKYLPYGGVISGFFGGLSGHQGAFRSMFLLRSGLGKEAFVGTGVVLAVMVDLSRTVIYGWELSAHPQRIDWSLVVAASLSAFAGAYFGARMLQKLTIKAIQIAVSVLLVVVAVGLVSGAL